jgi:hypothetical protein
MFTMAGLRNHKAITLRHFMDDRSNVSGVNVGYSQPTDRRFYLFGINALGDVGML